MKRNYHSQIHDVVNMRPSSIITIRQYRLITYYLILGHVSELYSSVLAEPEHLELANKLLSVGKHSDALPHFQEAIKDDPNNYLAYFKRATVYLAIDRPKSALEDLNKSLELNKDFVPALSQRASLYAKMGSLDAAHLDYERLLKLEPSKIEKMRDEIMNVKDLIENYRYDVTLSPQSSIDRNYASSECGSKVVGTNDEAKKASHVVNGMIDEYMLNPCKTKIWFVIELCEKVQPSRIEIANYELFSSTFKDFIVYFSDVYPASDWKLLGQYTASDSRVLQAFDLKQVGFGKYIRIELLSHYGNEHYCPISEVKVYGTSMVEDYEINESPDKLSNNNNDAIKTAKPRRRTSAYRVYRNMMTEGPTCGLLKIDKPQSKGNIVNNKKEAPNTPLPTQQPVVNRTSPLKPSVFVDLSNKVKALEASLKIQREEMERRLNQRLDKFTSEQRSFSFTFASIVIAYLVYKLMLDLL